MTYDTVMKTRLHPRYPLLKGQRPRPPASVLFNVRVY